jgi:hypothetical protein
VERLGVIASGLAHWARLNRDVVNGDARGVEKILEKIDFHRKQMGKVASLIKSTLDGSVQKAKKQIRANIDAFFDARYGSTMKQVVEAVRSYRMPLERYGDALAISGFTETLFLVYQDFKETLDTHLAEKVNPMIVKFVRDEEERIATYLASVAGPYETMVRGAVSDYLDSMEQIGISLDSAFTSRSPMIGPAAVRQESGLTLPPMGATMRYSARIKTEAVVKLGVYSLETLVRKLLKKDTEGNIKYKIKALEDGTQRMKRETERSVRVHLKDYKENIKFQYMYKFTDAMSERLYKGLLESFDAYFTDISNMLSLIREERIDKTAMLEELGKIAAGASQVAEKIDGLRGKLQQAAGATAAS